MGISVPVQLCHVCHGGAVLTFTDLAEQLSVLHEIKLVAGVQLSAADDAGEAVQVVHVLLGPTNDVRRRNSESTTSTFWTEFSEKQVPYM